MKLLIATTIFHYSLALALALLHQHHLHTFALVERVRAETLREKALMGKKVLEIGIEIRVGERAI